MADGHQRHHKPYVDPGSMLKELTVPSLVVGALMAIVLGAANVYLGLKAGMTVAATFPAAVISMAVLRVFRGNILEENIARTTGAVGEALAAGGSTEQGFAGLKTIYGDNIEMIAIGAGVSYWIGAAVIVGLSLFMINRAMSAINDPRPAADN